MLPMQPASHIELDGAVMFESQHAKLLRMHAWADSPLVGWEPVKFRKTRATDQLRWKLRRSPGQCTTCQTKRRNKFCTKQSCKQCCVAAAGGCATHAVGDASGGRAAAALPAAPRALRRCRQCGCASCPGRTRLNCDATETVRNTWVAAHGGKVPAQLRQSKVAACVKCAFACWASAPAAGPASAARTTPAARRPARAALAGAAAAAAESSSEPETSDSEANASGESEGGAEEEDAGADDDAHL